jgi:hypothetical protein
MELVDPGYVKPGVFAAENVDWVEVIGSDAHQTANLGGRYTWIKMGTPNIEGFRLALTDGDLSVCRHETVGSDKNEHADAILESITVSEAQYCGRGEELTVDLSPWLNTIIGGRGTGKSTLIELARICLRREGELSGAVKQTFDEFKRVPDSREDRGALTDNTQVRVVYRKDGVSYRINWHESNNLADIEERNSSNEWTPVKGDVTRRFPVRLYSQKQVYEMASGLESLLRVIDDTPDVNQSVWHDQWKKEESTYLSLCTQARQMEASLAEEGSLQGELDDIRRRLQVFEKSQYSEILTDYYSRQKQVGAVAKYAQRIRQLPSRLSETAEGFTEPLTENYLTKADVGDGEDAVELAAIYDLFCKDMEAIQTEVLRLAKNARKRIKKWRGDIRTSAWRQHVKTAEKRYLKLATSLAEQNAGEPDEYARLVKRRQMLLTRVAAFEGQRHKLGGIRIRQAESLTTLQKLRRLLTDKRRKFLSSVLDDNEYVSIEVIPYGNRAAVEDQFRRLINKEGTEFKNDIRSGNSEYPGVLDRLFNSYPSEGADDHQFEKCLDQMKTTLVAAAKGIATIRDVRDKRFVSHLERLWQESPEAFDRLMMWFPGDSLKVSYSPEAGGKFRPIDQGSPGQKTAAILAFLLAHGKEPIILDQPEDDLDNHLIYNLIVQQLRQNKQRRQIIVVTHNPNIVVNGDAELVFVLDATKGQTVIELQGGLQEQEVRNAICDVMEGGREAFDRRYRRISVEALR